MARQQLGHIDLLLEKQFGAIVNLPKVTAPFTTVVKRAQVTDFSKDLMPRMGIERIMTQAIQEVQGESGPAGEQVFKPINDFHDQVRIYGPGPLSENGPRGPNVNGGSLEITFYGTGLNALIEVDSTVRSLKSVVDGGALSAELYVAGSAVLSARNYSMNQPFPIVSGLVLGMHTVRLVASSGGIRFFGYEVLNEATTVKTPPGSAYLGGKKLSLAALDSQAFNTFENAVALGTRGGRMVTYLKSDGTIKKAFQPTSTSQANLSSADHTNEEIIRIFNWREFGAGRADDFSSVNTTSFVDKAFTLDDGVTTLLGFQIRMYGGGSDKTVNAANVGSFLTFTFIGTGLDIALASDGTTTAVTINGASVGNLGVVGTVPNATLRTKIVSGLPYGTHVVKLTSAGANLSVGDFCVYGPKRPTIPSDAIELADYYLMADYSVASSAAPGFTSAGVLKKFGAREAIYSGTWIAPSLDVTNFRGGLNIQTLTVASYMEYTFFGTGVEHHGFANNSSVMNFTVTVDGSALNAGTNVGSTSSLVAVSTGLTLSAAGTVTGTASGSGSYIVRVSGLALGKHTVRVTQNTAGNGTLYNDSFNVITPIHSPRGNLPGNLQNTATVGSCAIGDSRRFSELQALDIPNWSQALGITFNPSASSSAEIPMPDMSCILRTSGNPIEIFYSAEWISSAINGQALFRVYVDGISVGVEKAPQMVGNAAAVETLVQDSFIIPVAAGVHVVQVYWRVATGGTTITAQVTRRNMKVREI